MRVKTPTDILISAMEECEHASECVVIAANKGNGLTIFSTNDADYISLGIIEMAKSVIIRDVNLGNEP